MPAVLVVEFRIEAPHIKAFERAIQSNARQSLEQEPGCRRFDVCRDPGDEALFFLYEIYDDQSAIDAHLQSSHFLEMNTLTANWVKTKTVRQLSL